jgi:UDPglucose 6-dehydrogenase
MEAVENINRNQKMHIVDKVKGILGGLKGKKIAVWGLSFKPDTDDMREAPSAVIIPALQEQGAKIRAFDPIAIENAKNIFTGVEYAKNPYDALSGCDALLIITEWNEFRDLDKEKVRSLLNQPVIIDGRNIYQPNEMKKLGFDYYGIGRG